VAKHRVKIVIAPETVAGKASLEQSDPEKEQNWNGKKLQF
jgi:hypothetical protein